MLTLLRARNFTRAPKFSVVLAQAYCYKPGISDNVFGSAIKEKEKSFLIVGNKKMTKVFTYHEYSSSVKCFSCCRSLSSHTCASINDNELPDRTFAIEDCHGFEENEESANKDNAKILLAENGESSDSYFVDDDTSGNLSDVEDNKKDFIPLFKVILDAPPNFLNHALEKWVEKGNHLGRKEINTAIFNLRKRHLFGKALQFSEWLAATKHLVFLDQDYASHLDLIAKLVGIYKAEKYLESIPDSFRGEVVYRTLLANCVLVGNIKKAEEVFHKIRHLDFPLTTFVCNQLLLMYKKLDRKKMADVLSMMEKEMVKPDFFTYKLLIETKGHANDIEGMEKIIETMKAEEMELGIYGQAMVAKFYIYGGCNNKAEAVLKEMEGDEIEQTRGACRVLLPLYASLGKVDDVARLWKICEAKPYPTECLAAIDAWGKLGCIENAEAVFTQLLRSSKKPSYRYYSALLNVYTNHKLLPKAKDLLKRMSSAGYKIGPLVWDALIRLYLGIGQVEKADSILQNASEQNQKKPMYTSYLAVLSKYSRSGDVPNAEKIFHKLKSNGYSGRLIAYQSLLEAYANAKAPAYGFRERMKADDVFPNGTVEKLLISVDPFKKRSDLEFL